MRPFFYVIDVNLFFPILNLNITMKGKIMTIEYEVTYPVDWLDTNPTKKRFKTITEVEDWISEELGRRVEHTVAHSQYTLSEEDLEALQETENAMIQIKEV